MADYDETKSGAEGPFAAAYRAYLESVKQAWADVDIDELVRARDSVTFERYDCAGSVATIGSVATLGTMGATLFCVGTAGTIWLKPE